MPRTVKFIGAFLLIVSVAPLATAQTTFNFPIPVGGDLVGFAIVNPGSSTATATFRLYGFDGQLASSATKTVPPGGQLALLDSELFPVVTHQAEIGWVQIEGPSGIQAFAIGGNFVGTVDGASPPAAATQQILPLVAGQIRLYGVNPGTTTVSVRVQFVDASGSDVALPGGTVVDIPAKGMLGQVIDTTSGLGVLL